MTNAEEIAMGEMRMIIEMSNMLDTLLMQLSMITQGVHLKGKTEMIVTDTIRFTYECNNDMIAQM